MATKTKTKQVRRLSKAAYFDLLVNTSKEGGFPSTREKVCGAIECAYRGNEGRKCAVGLLIPKSAYKNEMEGLPAFELFESFPELCLYIPDGMLAEDIADIQHLHDLEANRLAQSPKRKWSHREFVKALKALSCWE